jgi:hypothetical protein
LSEALAAPQANTATAITAANFFMMLPFYCLFMDALPLPAAGIGSFESGGAREQPACP